MTVSYVIDIGREACRKAFRDRLSMIAAGVAFFMLLATFPGIAAMVALYSLVADPEKGGALLAALPAIFPEQAVEVITRQTTRIAARHGSGQALTYAPLLGLAILLWSTTKGIRSLFDALNIINDTAERRGFLRLTALSLAFTIGFILFLLFVIGAVFLLPPILDSIGLGKLTSLVLTLLRWPVLLVVAGISLSLIYRFGSNQENARPHWITMGSAVASLLWVLSSILFEWAISKFGGFDVVYGSLSALIGFMIWIWLSAMVLLFGAEIDAAARRRAMPSISSRHQPSAAGSRSKLRAG